MENRKRPGILCHERPRKEARKKWKGSRSGGEAKKGPKKREGELDWEGTKSGLGGGGTGSQETKPFEGRSKRQPINTNSKRNSRDARKERTVKRRRGIKKKGQPWGEKKKKNFEAPSP